MPRNTILQIKFALPVLGLWGAIAVALFAGEEGISRTPIGDHVTKTYVDAGIQMEVPVKVPFESSNAKGVLIMLHPISRGPSVEPDYVIKIYARRISKAELDSNLRISSHPLTDDFNKWLNSQHAILSVRKASKIWHVRKDIAVSSSEPLFINCSVIVTSSASNDLAEVERVVESIKPLR